jgi:hypothetical protein
MAFPYACAECGAKATVSEQGDIYRACGHDDATVIAERTSVLYGEGGAASLPLYQRALAALESLARKLG